MVDLFSRGTLAAAVILSASSFNALAQDTSSDVARALMPNMDQFEEAYQRAKASAARDGVAAQPGGRSRSWGAGQRTRGYHSEEPRDRRRKRVTQKKKVQQQPQQRVVQRQPRYSTAQVTFEYDSARLTPAGRSVLDRVIIPALNKVRKTVRTRSLSRSVKADVEFTVVGHTDATGSDEYNQELSDRRAQSVCNYIRAHGYNGQLTCVGVGETQLLNLADPSAPENRRVDIETRTFAVASK